MFGSDAEFDKRLRGLQPILPDLAAKSLIPEKELTNERISFQKRAYPGQRNNKQRQAVDIGPYFQMPFRLFSSGMGLRLGSSAGWLYAALCSQANDQFSMKFSVSNEALASDTGMSARTIGEAKKKLRALGLIEYSSKPGRRDQYTLKMPELERITRDERPRAKKKPRGNSKKEIDPFGWNGLPQILRGTSVSFARPSRKICVPA